MQGTPQILQRSDWSQIVKHWDEHTVLIIMSSIQLLYKTKKKQLSQEDIPEQMTIVAYPCSVLQLKFNPLVRIESWK